MRRRVTTGAFMYSVNKALIRQGGRLPDEGLGNAARLFDHAVVVFKSIAKTLKATALSRSRVIAPGRFPFYFVGTTRLGISIRQTSGTRI
jgi:hypothetical protein